MSRGVRILNRQQVDLGTRYMTDKEVAAFAYDNAENWDLMEQLIAELEREEGRTGNPPRVTQKDVDRAASSYHNNLMAYGENNMATQRAEWAYRDLQRKYAEQKSKRTGNPPDESGFKWVVRVVDVKTGREVIDPAVFNTRWKAAAYVMRWHSRGGRDKYKATVERVAA